MNRTNAKIEEELSLAIRAASDLSQVVQSMKERAHYLGIVSQAHHCLQEVNKLVDQLQNDDSDKHARS